MSTSRHRSFKRITRRDLERLAVIATAGFEDLFKRKPYSRPYKTRLLLICLCQGAARHYVYGDRGVHDFDVWGFFREIPGHHPFPFRWHGKRGFGPSKFGRNPEDGNRFVGRRVDMLGRSISKHPSDTPIEAVQRWLRDARNESPKLLARQPAVVIWPSRHLGRVIWDGMSA
jgi:hypothetical protein